MLRSLLALLNAAKRRSRLQVLRGDGCLPRATAVDGACGVEDGGYHQGMNQQPAAGAWGRLVSGDRDSPAGTRVPGHAPRTPIVGSSGGGHRRSRQG